MGGSAQMGRRSRQSVNEVDGSDQFQKAESPLHRLDSKGEVKSVVKRAAEGQKEERRKNGWQLSGNLLK